MKMIPSDFDQQDAPGFRVGDVIAYTEGITRQELIERVKKSMEEQTFTSSIEQGMRSADEIMRHCMIGKLKSRTDGYLAVDRVRRVLGGGRPGTVRAVRIENVVAVLRTGG